jgi:hypothetical protein
MSDITELFHQVAPSDLDPTPEAVEADLARGRAALLRDHRRRTIRRSMIGTTTLAAGVAAVLIASQVGGSSAPPTNHVGPQIHHPVTPSGGRAAHRSAKAIRLVAYTGHQLAGFSVDKVPAGWHLSGSTQYALTIDPAGDRDNNPDVFAGKLTVLLASQDETSFPAKGDHIKVDGQPGIIWDLGGIQLGYTDAAGHRIVVQVPNRLHWTDTQIVSFAEGVHVTGNALAGRG